MIVLIDAVVMWRVNLWTSWKRFVAPQFAALSVFMDHMALLSEWMLRNGVAILGIIVYVCCNHLKNMFKDVVTILGVCL